MKFVLAILAALLFPAVAFAQVLPLQDVMQTRVFGHKFDGKIHHLGEAMKPSKEGHAGYAPKHIVLGPGAYASANSADSSMKYYIDIQHESGFDTITYAGDQADLFFGILVNGELKDEIEFIVLIDPADKDYVGDVTYLAGYDKNGGYLGQMTIPRAKAAEAVAKMKAAA